MPHSIHIYSGTGHDFNPGVFRDAGWRAEAFFDEHVKETEKDKVDAKPTGATDGQRKSAP